MRIFLTGFMGAGKTTYGIELAKKCKMDFIDLDNYIEQYYKKSIHQIFKEKGESGFREIEKDSFFKVAQNEKVIIATGGGTPCYNNLMQEMNKIGLTVYLKLFPEVLFKHLKNLKAERPLISGMNDKELKFFINEKLNERAPFYLQSSIIIDPVKMNADKMAKVIIFKYI